LSFFAIQNQKSLSAISITKLKRPWENKNPIYEKLGKQFKEVCQIHLILQEIEFIIKSGNAKILENKIRNIILTYSDFHGMISTKKKFLQRADKIFDLEQNALTKIIGNLKGIESKFQKIINDVIF
jgi:hypothetical protein